MATPPGECKPSCDLSKALASGEFSDLTIRCQNKDFSVHKVIVCSQVKFFRAACINGCKESFSGIIDLTEDDPVVVEHLITFLYTSFYTVGDPHQGLLDVKLYSAADKYDIPALSTTAKMNFKKWAASTLLRIKSNKNAGPDLVSAKQDLTSFISCISKIYDSTPQSNRGLRDIVVKQASNYGYLLRDTACKDEFQQLLQDVPDFTWDLLGLYQQEKASPGAAKGCSKKRPLSKMS